ncbi:hypothetical protein [Granulicella arctica]|uniref:Uncharacterized protein n=1 Tax=Granulicella arctica TaxID=940613 RepID=A0A7Y9TF03_9BACT|nr:hypothetical protein [Granulicella arctica]NYF78236.1 hypothetical protein [Granulicella arctica]
MSISPITSSLTLLDSSLYASTTSGTTTTTSTSSTTTTAADSTDSTSTTALEKDLAALLKALVAGDVSGAKSLLVQVQKDAKAQDASTSSSTSSDSSSLDKLLSKISDSLNSGDTSSALQDVATYLVQSGTTSGTLLNTVA